MSEMTVGRQQDKADHPAVALAARRVAVALALAVLGGLMVYGAGFAQPSALHDAAHDTRHAFAFPCH